MPLVGRQEEHPACKIEWWDVGVVICLERRADCLRMLMPSFLASFKSRLVFLILVLPLWYQFTQVVLEKRPLNDCSAVVAARYIIADRKGVVGCWSYLHVFADSHCLLSVASIMWPLWVHSLLEPRSVIPVVAEFSCLTGLFSRFTGNFVEQFEDVLQASLLTNTLYTVTVNVAALSDCGEYNTGHFGATSTLRPAGSHRGKLWN